jgi:hypothetical protein
MSCTTARESRCVTVFQWRSMNANATTDCRITIGSNDDQERAGIEALRHHPRQ